MHNKKTDIFFIFSNVNFPDLLYFSAILLYLILEILNGSSDLTFFNSLIVSETFFILLICLLYRKIYDFKPLSNYPKYSFWTLILLSPTNIIIALISFFVLINFILTHAISIVALSTLLVAGFIRLYLAHVRNSSSELLTKLWLGILILLFLLFGHFLTLMGLGVLIMLSIVKLDSILGSPNNFFISLGLWIFTILLIAMIFTIISYVPILYRDFFLLLLVCIFICILNLKPKTGINS